MRCRLASLLVAAAAFFTAVDDLPLMPGLIEPPGAGAVIAKPEGRIAELFAAGPVERAAVEKFYADIPETARFFVMAGNPTPDNGFTVLALKPWSQREKSQQQIARELMPKLQSLPGVLAFPLNPPSLGGSRGAPVQFVVMTQAPYPELQRMVERLMDEARKNPNLVNIDTDLRLNQPELRVGVNREKLADVGVPVETVGRTLETLLGGRIVTRFKRDGEQYDVLVQVADSDRTNPREVGFLDSAPFSDDPGHSATQSGAWSNYPFFKSGVVIFTSVREGLFIVKVVEPKPNI